MKMKDKELMEFVDNVIQERMQNAFSKMKAGKNRMQMMLNRNMRKRCPCFQRINNRQSEHTVMLFLIAEQMPSSSFIGWD